MTSKIKNVVFQTQLDDQKQLFDKAKSMRNFSKFVRTCLDLFSESDISLTVEEEEIYKRIDVLKSRLTKDFSASTRSISRKEIEELEAKLGSSETKKERIRKRLGALKSKMADKSLHRSTHHRIEKKIEQLEQSNENG